MVHDSAEYGEQTDLLADKVTNIRPIHQLQAFHPAASHRRSRGQHSLSLMHAVTDADDIFSPMFGQLTQAPRRRAAETSRQFEIESSALPLHWIGAGAALVPRAGGHHSQPGNQRI